MQTGERQNVYEVYNKIAGWFSTNRPTDLSKKKYLDDLIKRLPANATILDLGCGTGNPILKYLVDNKMNVTGVDASSEILAIAKANLPHTTFILQDMRLLNLNKKFDAIIAWHSFFHLPASDQPAMFHRFEQHLNVDGILIFTSGTELSEAWGMNGGENLFHASLDSAAYKDLLHKHGFQVLQHTINDAECGYATVWVAQYAPAI